MQHTELNWHKAPEAVALFDKAWDICGADNSVDFPYDIEAELDALCDEAYLIDSAAHCTVSAWDAYVAEQVSA
jgi:hypothetical protein